METGIAGRTALVCGASKGLGFASAMALAREGVDLVLASRTKEDLEKAAEEIRGAGRVRVMVHQVDLSQDRDVVGLAAAALESYGKVDILVNNAGGPPTGQFFDFNNEDWDKAYRMNLMSAVILTRELAPGMKDRAWGRIINITSIAVKQPLDGLILSNAVRAGVHGWAKSLSNELAQYQITVNNVLPGFTMTDRVRSMSRALAEKQSVSPDEIISGWEAGIPMRRIGRPEELGALVAFLASEWAGYITGVSIPVDGGFYKGLM